MLQYNGDAKTIGETQSGKSTRLQAIMGPSCTCTKEGSPNLRLRISPAIAVGKLPNRQTISPQERGRGCEVRQSNGGVIGDSFVRRNREASHQKRRLDAERALNRTKRAGNQRDLLGMSLRSARGKNYVKGRHNPQRRYRTHQNLLIHVQPKKRALDSKTRLISEAFPSQQWAMVPSSRQPKHRLHAFCLILMYSSLVDT